MRKRSPIRNGVEYCAAWIALKSMEYAPLGLANRLARFYARLLDRGIPRLRRVARQNLAMALPEFTPLRHAAASAASCRGAQHRSTRCGDTLSSRLMSSELGSGCPPNCGRHALRRRRPTGCRRESSERSIQITC
jgi:hypothetical protein